MGLSDRDYTHSDYADDDDLYSKRRRPRRKNGRSIVLILIAVNFALWLANGLLFENNALTNLLLLQKEYFANPTGWYRYLTYGFVHDYGNIWHIVFNMFGLLMFGYGMMLGIGPGGFGFVRGENVEGRLGKLEFFAFYCLTIILGGVAFALMNFNAEHAGVLGASGGVCGVIILYAWLYPRKTLLLYGILPLPMWAIGVLIVVVDAMGASGNLGGQIAYSVHLVGAACGTAYYFLFIRQGLKLTGWMETASVAPAKRERSQRKFQVHIHTPDEGPSVPEDEFGRRLDDILKRYGEVGESGLTDEEREFLKQASKKFAEKHRK
ncbi:MAG: rhomboid family intramembrane serine protease [Planctomycetaceae bacterium]|nr:rhomboid family intramembrane serine protease [Planctomycetaceae bacterium]